MKKKVGMIGAVILAVSLMAGDCANCYSKIHTSAQTFQKYFQGLRQPGVSVNTIERFVFSLMLANTKTHQMKQTSAEKPLTVSAPRTS